MIFQTNTRRQDIKEKKTPVFFLQVVRETSPFHPKKGTNLLTRNSCLVVLARVQRKLKNNLIFAAIIKRL